jgi:uncharacterized FlaG/YvyC family protein
MPLEGVNPAGRLIPESQKTEAAQLGAFQTRVEENARIKPLNEEDEKNQPEEEEEQPSAIYETREEEDEETPMPKQAEVLDEKAVSYTFRFNKYTELVELIDIATGKVIQTMLPQDLIELVSKLRYTSGVFIDSEI